MSAPTEDKAYFLALEPGENGDQVALAEFTRHLRFNDQGLLPAITQDAETGEVLMLAWVNIEAIEHTLATGRMTYFSRSRNSLWLKGETSGHYQQVVDLGFDCDGDALLSRVIQTGSACHTERKNCFYLQVDPAAGAVRNDDSSNTDFAESWQQK